MEITQAQRARLLVRMHEWVEEGRSTAPADEERAELALADIYKLAGRDPPEMTWAASPLDALMQAQGQSGSNIAIELSERLRKRATEIVIRHGVDMAALACGKAGEELLAHTAFVDLQARVWALQRPRPPAGQIVRLHDLIEERLTALATWNSWPGKVMNQFLRGALVPFTLYAVEALAYGLKIGEAWALLPYAVLGRSAGFVLPLEGRAWLCARPTVMDHDTDGLLHAEGGPALDWDGQMPFYLWHDRLVSQKLVAPVATWHWRDIIDETDRERRALMLERFGLERFLRRAGRVVHEDETGRLWSTGPTRFMSRISAVEVVNGTPEPDGSRRHYWIRVPPDIRRARAGVAWTYGIVEKRYQLDVRT